MEAEPPSVTLTEAELISLTGYRQPAKQLTALHSLGFWRARRSILGAVVLEREHYTAVCRGTDTKPAAQQFRPKLRMPA